MYGLSNSTSTLNQETIKLLNNLGLSSKSHWSKYLGSTPVVDSLLGIKYLIAETDDTSVPDFYNAVYSTKNEKPAKAILPHMKIPTPCPLPLV